MEAAAVAAPYSGQPPSPTAVFNELYSFSGFMTRHQMKTLQDTIDQNRQDALNSSCKSSDSLEESLAARQHDYLKNILKSLRGGGGGGNAHGSVLDYSAADFLLKENANASLEMLRLLNDHLALFGPQCYGCLALEKDSKAAIAERLIASPGKRRGGAGGGGRRAPKSAAINGYATGNSSSSSSKFTPPTNYPPITRGSARKRSLSECTKGVMISVNNASLLNHVLKRQAESSFESSHDSSSSGSEGDASVASHPSTASKSSKSAGSRRRGSNISNASAASNGSNESCNNSGSNGERGDYYPSFDSRHQRQLPCPELEETLDMAALVASWESASETHGKTLAKGGSGGGSHSSRDYSYNNHHHHHHNHYHNHHHHHPNSLLDPSLLIDDEYIEELHQKRIASARQQQQQASNRPPPIHFVGLGELGLQQPELCEKQPPKFFPTPSEDVPYLRSHDPFGILDQRHKEHSASNSVAESPRHSETNNILNGGSSFSAAYSARRRLSSSFEDDFKDEKSFTEGGGGSNDDLDSTIKLLTGHLSSVTQANSRTVGDLWVKTQQEMALQELREKMDNHHALLCHEFTPYFSMKRKNNGLVPTATRNNILTTMANLSEDKSGADRIRRELSVTEYIDEVFRLRQSTLVAPPSQPSDGGLNSSDAAAAAAANGSASGTEGKSPSSHK